MMAVDPVGLVETWGCGPEFSSCDTFGSFDLWGSGFLWDELGPGAIRCSPEEPNCKCNKDLTGCHIISHPDDISGPDMGFYNRFWYGVCGNVRTPVLGNDPARGRVFERSEPQRPKAQKVTAGCFSARLIHNFVGDDSRAGVALTLNIAAGIALRKLGTRAVASLLPGPGWVYVIAATLYDLGQVGNTCTVGPARPKTRAIRRLND